jgi:hypothetical protein
MVVAAGGVAVSRCSSWSEVPPSAVAAWRTSTGEQEIRRFALAHALLAPNPHNMQPWLADLRRDGEILLRLDPSRLLPATDPFGRQILMGAGAFLEILRMAAAERGHRADCEVFPEGEPGDHLDGRPFCRVRIAPDPRTPRDPLFAHVLLRRTDRRAYDPSQALTIADAAELRLALGELPVRIGVATNAARVAPIREITREAWRIEVTTPSAMLESMRVLRVGNREIDAHRDGLTITSPMMVLANRLGLLDRSQCPPPDSRITRGLIDEFDVLAASTPAYVSLVTEGNRRNQQLDAGRAYVRVNLAAAGAGLAMHPNEQALQEYPQMAKPYQAIHTLLDAPSPRCTVQMLARVGRLPAGEAAAPPAPRRGLAAHLEG